MTPEELFRFVNAVTSAAVRASPTAASSIPLPDLGGWRWVAAEPYVFGSLIAATKRHGIIKEIIVKHEWLTRRGDPRRVEIAWAGRYIKNGVSTYRGRVTKRGEQHVLGLKLKFI